MSELTDRIKTSNRVTRWVFRHIPEALNSKLLLASAAVGIIIGVAVAIMEYLVIEVFLHHLLEWPLWIQAGAPLVGLLISYWFLRVPGGGVSPATSEEYISQFHSRIPSFSLRAVQSRLAAGAATIGLGGALGLEGPSIYLGSATGHFVHQSIENRLGRGSAQQLLTAGAAAGVSAVFQAPATGVVFALEAPYRNDVAHRALLPSLVASAASFLVFVSMPLVGEGARFGFATDRSVGGGELLGAVVLGIGAGLGGRGFAWFVRRAKTLPDRVPPLVLILIGGVMLGGLAVASDSVFGEPLTLGPGASVFDWLQRTTPLSLIVALFFFRAAATLTTVGAGGVGGLFVPLAVQGILLGRIVGDGLDRLGIGEAEDLGLWPILGLAAFLAAGYRTPIAAVMFVAESSRGTAVVPALIAAAVSQLVAGSSSVSLAQREERLGGLESRLALPISAVIETDVLTVPPEASVSDFVFVHALGQREPVVPVVDGNRYLGLCSIHDAAGVDRAEWDDQTVADIMDTTSPTGHPWWSLRDAVAALSHSPQDLLAVTEGEDSFVGLVRDSEIVKLDEILVETESADPKRGLGDS